MDVGIAEPINTIWDLVESPLRALILGLTLRYHNHDHGLGEGSHQRH